MHKGNSLQLLYSIDQVNEKQKFSKQDDNKKQTEMKKKRDCNPKGRL